MNTREKEVNAIIQQIKQKVNSHFLIILAKEIEELDKKIPRTVSTEKEQKVQTKLQAELKTKMQEYNLYKLTFQGLELNIWQKLLRKISTPESKSQNNTFKAVVTLKDVAQAVGDAFDQSCKLYKNNYKEFANGDKTSTTLFQTGGFIPGALGGHYQSFLNGRTLEQFIEDGLPNNVNFHSALFNIKKVLDDMVRKESLIVSNQTFELADFGKSVRKISN